MWCEAGFEPDRFWIQTPYHFQLAMRGVRRKLEAAAEASLRQAWWTGAFAGLTQSKDGLKPLSHYLGQAGETKMEPDQMLAAFQSMEARGMPIAVRKISRSAGSGETTDG